MIRTEEREASLRFGNVDLGPRVLSARFIIGDLVEWIPWEQKKPSKIGVLEKKYGRRAVIRTGDASTICVSWHRIRRLEKR
jgi:hypothetical protein